MRKNAFNFNKSFLILALSMLTFAGCKKDDDKSTDKSTTTEQPYQSGVFVANQGPFQTGTGTITYYNRTNKSTVQDIFQKENGRPLGNVVQSIEIFNGKAYIVVNNAGKVEIADAGTFKSVGVINGLQSPRYFLGIDANKGYISDWSLGVNSGNIKVINLSTNTVIKTIATGNYPDKMLKVGNKVFVINSAGWTKDSTITIVDATTDTPIKTFVVGHNPNSLTIDANGKVWVLCGGINDWTNAAQSTAGKIVRINPDNYTIEYSYTFPSNAIHPLKLCSNANKNKLFYIYGSNISYYDINSSEIVPFIYRNNVNGLGYDNATNYIYATDPKDYKSNGWVIRYNSTTGAPVDSFQVGIIPEEMFFN
jgi:hypothetical protein